MYDAVMSIGFGACLASRRSDGSVDGRDHHNAIRSLRFKGASGNVAFGRDVLERGGTRWWQSLDWVAINYRESGHYELADVLIAQNISTLDNPDDPPFEQIVTAWREGGSLPWFPGSPLVYADGTTTAPMPLRDPGDQHLVDPYMKALGLSLTGATMLTSLMVIIWVYRCRQHRVIAASQPMFLYIISIGTVGRWKYTC